MLSLMCMLSRMRVLSLILDPLMLEPLLIAPVLSDAGATAPAAVVVSVAEPLSDLLQAANTASPAMIAMRFMKSSVEIMNR
jgi:hypothetical protein